jgi:hypothetical protein
MAEYHSSCLGSRVELGTERESFLQVLDENANFGGQPAAGRPHCEDWHRSLKGSQKADDGTFSEFCREEPCWRLGNPQMFKDTHPQLFNIAGSKDSCGDNTLHALLTPSTRPGMTYKLDSGTGRCRGDQFSDRVRL